jgi:Na+/melibiose symporter-like transporter
MGGWRRYLELQAQAKTGLGSGLLIWALLAAMCGTLTAGFILLVAFIWLAERYDPLSAAAALAGFFLLVTIIALICCVWSRRRTMERAELALAARRHAIWLDPKVLASAIQVSRAVGWRKLLPLLAVGVLAAGAGMEWFGRDGPQVESEQNGRRKLARTA